MTTRDEAPKERLSYEEVIAQLSATLDKLAGVERNTPQEKVKVEVQVSELRLDAMGRFQYVDWGTSGITGSHGSRVLMHNGVVTETKYPEEDELRVLNPWVYGQTRYGNISELSLVTIEEPSVVVIIDRETFVESKRSPELEEISIQVLTTPEHIQELKALDQRL